MGVLKRPHFYVAIVKQELRLLKITRNKSLCLPEEEIYNSITVLTYISYRTVYSHQMLQVWRN